MSPCILNRSSPLRLRFERASMTSILSTARIRKIGDRMSSVSLTPFSLRALIKSRTGGPYSAGRIVTFFCLPSANPKSRMLAEYFCATASLVLSDHDPTSGCCGIDLSMKDCTSLTRRPDGACLIRENIKVCPRSATNRSLSARRQ